MQASMGFITCECLRRLSPMLEELFEDELSVFGNHTSVKNLKLRLLSVCSPLLSNNKAKYIAPTDIYLREEKVLKSRMVPALSEELYGEAYIISNRYHCNAVYVIYSLKTLLDIYLPGEERSLLVGALWLRGDQGMHMLSRQQTQICFHLEKILLRLLM